MRLLLFDLSSFGKSMPTIEVVNSFMAVHDDPKLVGRRQQMAAFSTNDLLLSAALLIAVLGAAAWLIASGWKHDALRRARAERWHNDYFRRGGLVRALMARWSSQPKLIDRSNRPSE